MSTTGRHRLDVPSAPDEPEGTHEPSHRASTHRRAAAGRANRPPTRRRAAGSRGLDTLLTPDRAPARRSSRGVSPMVAAVTAVALVVGGAIVLAGPDADPDPAAELQPTPRSATPAPDGPSSQLAGLFPSGGGPAAQAAADASSRAAAAEAAAQARANAANDRGSQDGQDGSPGQQARGGELGRDGQPTPSAPRRPTGPIDALGRSAAALFGWGAHDPSKGDEFDGSGRPSGIWGSYDSAGNGGNGRRSSGQNTLAGGLLTIAGTADGTTGGMMSTGVQPAYGRWEVRMRVDKQGGGGAYHPVVALVPHGQAYDGGAGDLDFAETDAGSGQAYCFIHYPQRKQDTASTRVDLADWHTYAVEVAPTHISWFVDGKPLMTDTNKAALTGTPWTLNVQLDANQGGGLAPSSMQLDYFRYYPLPDGAAPPRAPGPMTGSYGG